MQSFLTRSSNPVFTGSEAEAEDGFMGNPVLCFDEITQKVKQNIFSRDNAKHTRTNFQGRAFFKLQSDSYSTNKQ